MTINRLNFKKKILKSYIIKKGFLRMRYIQKQTHNMQMTLRAGIVSVLGLLSFIVQAQETAGSLKISRLNDTAGVYITPQGNINTGLKSNTGIIDTTGAFKIESVGAEKDIKMVISDSVVSVKNGIIENNTILPLDSDLTVENIAADTNTISQAIFGKTSGQLLIAGIFLGGASKPVDILITNNFINEHEAPGTIVGIFSTVDPDTGETFAYSFVTGTGDSDNASFTISGDTLKTAQIFDYETKANYGIRIQTDDGNGGVFEKQFIITVLFVDTIAPVVVITLPLDGFITNHTPIDISWTVDGVVQTTQLTENLVEGANTITRNATDAAGNTGSDTITVTLDTQAPVVVITSPLNGLITNQPEIHIVWTVDGTQYESDTTLTEGAHFIKRTTADAAGNTGSDTVSITVDLTAPVVVITSPADGFISNSNMIDIAWTIDGITQTTQLTENLVAGQNIIIRSATDNAANVGADTIVVFYELQGEEISIVSPVDGFISTNTNINFTVSAPSDLNNFMAIVDGIDQTSQFVYTAGSFNATISVTDGYHTFIVYAVYGNNSTDTATTAFKVNTAVPETEVHIKGVVINGKIFENLPGATVQIVETGSSVTTDSEGKFDLPSGGYGNFKLKVTHPDFTIAMRLVSADSGINVELPYIPIMPIDTNVVEVQAGVDTTVALSDSMVELDFPAGALPQDMAVSATVYNDISQLPNIQPTQDLFLFCVDLQPNGAVFNDSITVRAPNLNQLSANAEVPITYFNENTAMWDSVGIGNVTEDGRFIEFKTKHFSVFHGNTHFLNKIPNTPGQNNFNDDWDNCNETGASSVNVKNGDLTLDYSIDGGHALTDIGVKLIYASNTANPRTSLETKINKVPVTPTYNSWTFQLPGQTKQWVFHGASQQTAVKYIWDGKTEDGKELETGLHPYGILIKDFFDVGTYRYDYAKAENIVVELTTPVLKQNFYYGFFTLINRKNSPYGAGWAIEGVTKIVRKKSELTGPFPHKVVYFTNAYGNYNETKKTIPVNSSIAIGKTKGDLDGDHVAIVGAGSENSIFWYNDSCNCYLPPYGSFDELLNTGSGWIRTLSNGTVEIYNGQGLLLSRENKNGQKTVYTYDTFGERVIKITDASTGKYTTLNYDARGRLISIQDQYGRITEISIDDNNNLVSIETPDGNIAREFVYDNSHRAVKKNLVNGAYSEYSYDKYGGITQTKVAGGKITKFFRATDMGIVNDLQPAKENVPFYSVQSVCIYTSEYGNCSMYKDFYYPDVPPPIHALKFVSKYENKVIINDKENVAYENTPAGLIKTNGNGEKTVYYYDDKENCNCNTFSRVQYPNNLIITNTTDEKGNILTTHNSHTKALTTYSYTTINGVDYVDAITNALNQKTDLSYNQAGSLVKITSPGGDSTTITYNNLHLPQTITDTRGRTVTTLYDSLGKVVARINPVYDTTVYEYNEYENLARIIDPLKRQSDYEYDIMGKLISEADPAGNSTRYAYNLAGQLDSLIDPKGHVTTFAYDSAGNLIESRNHLGYTRSYTYDRNNNLTSYANARGQTINYGYDILNRLVSKSIDDSLVMARFGYNTMGDMTYAANEDYSISRVFDPAGRMLQETASKIRSTDTINTKETITADDYSYDYSHLVIDGDTVVIDGEHHFLSLTLTNGAVVKHLPTTLTTIHRMRVFARDYINIEAGSRIDVTGLGYLGGNRGENDTTAGRTDNNLLAGGSSPGSGGSHGGRGGAYIYSGSVLGYAAVPYDNLLWPVQPGGGGGSNGNPGFNGGGVVHLNAPEIFINGEIITDGETALNDNGGAGAGGSIIVEGDVIRGNGQLVSRGGNGIDYGRPMGGGGGRILIRGNQVLDSIYEKTSVGGGLFGGAGGTIALIINGSLTTITTNLTDGTQLYIDRYDESYENATLVVDNSQLTIDGEHTFHEIILRNNALLTCSQPKDTNDIGMVLNVSKCLYVDSSSTVNMSSKGYPGASNDYDSDSIFYSPAYTKDFKPGSTGLSGGSYGGLGYSIWGNSGFQYGNIKTPYDFGGGGSCDSSKYTYLKGGNGGGRFSLTAKKLFLDGTIEANGEESNMGGGGAGGSIYISADTLEGGGMIRADGGRSLTYGTGSGGGGRVSVNVNNFLFNISRVTAKGGGGIWQGKSGTIYFGHLDSIVRDTVGKLPLIAEFSNESFHIDKNDYRFENFDIIIKDGVLLIIDGQHTFKSMTLLNNAILSSSTITDSNNAGLILKVDDSIAIDSSSIIYLKAKGYAGARCYTLNESDSIIFSPAYTIGFQKGSTGLSGGSYGGQGGAYKGTVGLTYGTPELPSYFGSGGSCDSLTIYSRGGWGGGILSIQTKKLYLDGKINADGGNGFCGGGGSGGSISIYADTLEGLGEITANGGIDNLASVAGGGGGRIAIYSNELLFNLENISAFGGDGVAKGMAGTVYIACNDTIISDTTQLAKGGVELNIGWWEGEPLPLPNDIVLDSGNYLIDSASIHMGRYGSFTCYGNHYFKNITLEDYCYFIASDTLKVRSISIFDGCLTHHETTIDSNGIVENRLFLIADTINIGHNGYIDVGEKGYPDGYIVINGNVELQGEYAGGSHGGKGSGLSGPIYGDYREPILSGSGGGTPGTAGGGIIRIITNILNNNGAILANAEYRGDYDNWGNGAGGSIWISADKIVGNGRIEAKGGSMGYGGWWSPKSGGGGGRIALYCSELSDSILKNTSAAGGYNSGDGSVYIADVESFSHDSLFLNNNGNVYFEKSDTAYKISSMTIGEGTKVIFKGNVDADYLKVNGEAQFDEQADVHHLIIGDTLFPEYSGIVTTTDTLISDTIDIIKGTLTCKETTLDKVSRLNVICQNIIRVTGYGKIDVTGKGYPAGYTYNGEIASTDSLSGGSHGGKGTGFSCNMYDNFLEPFLPGAGGGFPGMDSINNGGGVIRIVTDVLENKGYIIANGGLGSGDDKTRRGAGGSIWITANEIKPTDYDGWGAYIGFISADGAYDWDNTNGGGGGRIGIYCSNRIPNSTIYALNLHAYSGSDSAGVGTLFLKDSTNRHGNLFLGSTGWGNGGIYSPDSSTYITSIGTGIIDSITANTIVCDTCHFTVYHDSLPGLKGLTVNVNPGVINDTNTQFKIIWNDSTTIIVDTTGGRNLLDYTNTGYGFQGIINLDTLTIKSGAKGYSGDPVIYDEIIIDYGKFSDPLHGIQTGSAINKDSDLRYAQKNEINNSGTALKLNKKTALHKKRAPTGIKTLFNNIFALKEKMALRKIEKEKRKQERAFRKEQAKNSKKDKENLSLNTNIKKPDAVQLASASISDYNTGAGFVSRFKPAQERFAFADTNAGSNNKCANGDPVYTYDKLDRVTSMTSPAGTTTYLYDTITGRLDKIISPEGKEFSYQYDRGQLESMMYTNGITANYTFDDNGNLTGLDYRNGASSVRSYNYTYDKNSMRDTMIDNDGVHAYGYDQLYQVISATHPTVQNPLEQFQYDQVGNRLGNDRVHNELNQLTEDDSCWYNYDADGNMTEKISKSTGDTTYFIWDIENKLAEVRKPGMIARYAYDPLGRRVRKTVNGVVKEMRYDGQDLIMEMDENDVITASYTFGPGIDNPLLMTRNGNSYYYVKDGLGSVSAITSESGNVLQEYRYSVFGEIVEQTADSIENPFTYTAREYDTETGNYYYRARYYDGGIGRFLSEDYVRRQGEPNLYGYVRNNSINFIDPQGEFPWLIALAIWAGSAYLGGSAGNAYFHSEQITYLQDYIETQVGIKWPADQYPGMNYWNDQADAWKHAEWSRLVAEKFGPGTSFTAGFGHELDNLQRQIGSKKLFLDEFFMDMHNNLQGILSGKTADELLKENKLFILDPYDPCK